MVRFLSLLALNLIYVAGALASEPILLFEGTHVHPDYYNIISAIKKGGTPRLKIVLPGGESTIYQVKKYINQGSLTHVISVEGDQVLMVPTQFGRNPLLLQGTMEEMLGKRLDAYEGYKKSGVKVVEYFPDKSIPNRLIVALEVHNPRDLNQMLQFMSRLKKESTSESLKKFNALRSELELFCRSTYAYKTFGDFRESQILYGENTGFALADWDENTFHASYRDSGTIFTMDTADMRRAMHQNNGNHFSNTVASKLELQDSELKRYLLDSIFDERTKRGMIDSPSCFAIFKDIFRSVIPKK